MSQSLLLVGAGGLAREVLAAARALPGEFTVRGLLDDDPARHGSEVDGVPVLGPSDLVHEHTDDQVLVCVASPGRPEGRANVVRRLDLPAERYATLVHPAASVAYGVEFGEGTVLLAGTVITAPQRVGAHVLAMPHVLFTHDDLVGDFATCAGRATLAGGVVVAESAYLGAGSLVRQGVRIGSRAVIGMGAVVLADVPDGETWVGVPAKPLVQS
ncbi:acetyltransferase [Actinokineospora cianjurensis]|uniref:Sugar O-acyltransferase (Sialic acid O-acetyltransferase NeuD family) n=1 Tax=Actinokineospora cianjurensis TaxID=585224 RepID=A0A421B8N4_9PSEU|nr:acetyltransferase [Actinokineospora cianjurensis]RLK60560.1 sugar O-acyltransferase (sialic acid O-acetyltransferase NeuD family) [Actinokineospora cianjurensis]